MHLSRFPHAIRVVLFNEVCPSYLIIELWKCGDTDLNSKLAKDVTEMYLRCDSTLVSRFPRMISELRSLRRLSIRSPHKLHENPILLQIELLKIAGTLESLKFHAPDCHALFLNFHPSVIPKLVKDASYYDESVIDCSLQGVPFVSTNYELRGKSRYLDVETLFPRLTEWALTPSNQYPWAHHAFSYDDFAPVLPKRLTTFGGPHMTWHSEEAEILWRNFPPALERLEASVTFASKSKSRFTSPPSLTYIETCSCVAHESHIQSSGLPDSLTASSSVTINQYVTPTYLRSLPPSLERLLLWNRLADQAAFEALQTHWCAEMPKGLKELKVRFSPSSLSIAGLPRGLESLYFLETSDTCDWSSLSEQVDKWHAPQENPSPWPSTLRLLNLTGFIMDTRYLNILPPSLDTLAIRLSAQQRKGGLLKVSPLPPHLTHLSIQTNWNGKKIVIPTRYLNDITFLQINNKQSAIGFSEQMFALLPPTIRTLRVPLNNAEGKKGEIPPPWTFPTSLTELEANFLSPDWFGSLPPTLIKLRISTLQGFVDDAEVDCFANLPKHLLQLQVKERSGQSAGRTLHPSAFSTLKDLRYLSVSDIEAPSSIISGLSRELRYLDLSFKSLNPEDSLCFPPNLLFLSLGPVFGSMTAEQLDWWPIRAVKALPQSMQQEILALIMNKPKRQPIIGSRGIGLISVK